MNRNTWIAMLAKLVQPSDPAHAAAALRDMLPMMRGYPDSAFSQASLEHVAATCRRLPSYGELRAALMGFCGPMLEPSPVPQLPAPQPREPASEEAKAAVSALARAFVAERSWKKPNNAIGDKASISFAPLSSGALLASYEKLAADGDQRAGTRVAMLRAQIAKESKDAIDE